jgi:hypothetical protein
VAKSKWRQEQDEGMAVYPVRMTAAHARHARKKGAGNVSEGVRKLIEEEADGGRIERRTGPADRRKKPG